MKKRNHSNVNFVAMYSYSKRRIFKKCVASVHEINVHKYCDYSCSQKQSMNLHIEAFHKEEKSCKCAICDHNFTTEQHWTRHIDAVHKGIKNHVCTT